MNSPVVFDTSAILAFVDDEEGAETVQKHLVAASHGKGEIFASFVTLTEVRYITIQEKDEASADYLIGLIKSWPLHWIHSDESLCLLAGRFKARHRISLADAFVAATAFRVNACLLHKDSDFESLGDTIELIALPRKSRRK